MPSRRRFVAAVLAGALSWPSHAQERVVRLGYLGTRASHSALDQAFFDGLREHGYVPGRNLVIEDRWAGNDFARLPALAEELVRLRVDVIVTAATAGTRAAMRATRTIPIVMAASADPVGAGLVASLARPGGNVTGMSLQTTDMAAKRLQLALELVPGVTRVGLLAEHVADPSQGTTAALIADTTLAARQMRVALAVREVKRAHEFDDAFAHFRDARVQVLVVQVSPLMIQHRDRVVALAAGMRLPAIYEARDFADAGGLASYGPDLAESYRRAAAYVHRILQGAKPADLPVEQPQKLALVINAKAAAAIGLALPQPMLMRADELLN